MPAHSSSVAIARHPGGGPGAAAADVPQLAQNFALATELCRRSRCRTSSAPTRGVPHSAQNFPPGCLAPHLPHVTCVPPGDERAAAGPGRTAGCGCEPLGHHVAHAHAHGHLRADPGDAAARRRAPPSPGPRPSSPAPRHSSDSCRRASARSARPGRTSGRARTAWPARPRRRRPRRSASTRTSRWALATSALARDRMRCWSSSVKLMLNAPICRMRMPMSLRSGAWATKAAASLLVSDTAWRRLLPSFSQSSPSVGLHAVHEEALDPVEDQVVVPGRGLARVADDEPHRVGRPPRSSRRRCAA